MRADIPLGITAVDPCANSQPEGFGVTEMAAEGVPFQSWMLTAQSAEACGGEPAPLVVRNGIRLLHPGQSAVAADLVIDGEHLLAAKAGRPLAPAGAVG